VILKAAEGMESIFHIPYYCIVYMLQSVVCFASVYYVLRKLYMRRSHAGKPGFMAVWSTLAILTTVPVMQCIMALLPYALLMALVFLQFYFTHALITHTKDDANVNGRQDIFHIAYILIIWLAEALLLHEYFLFGAVPVVVAAVQGLWVFVKKRDGKYLKNTAFMAVGAAVISAVLFMVYDISAESGIYNEENPGLVKGLFRRTAYTTVFKNWDNWTEDIVENIDWNIRYSASYYADNIALELEPYVDEKFGDGAEEFYKSVTAYAWKNYRTQLVHEMIWDEAGYIVQPVIMKLQLKGMGTASSTVRNYDIMKRATPILTKYYVDYFVDFNIAAIVLCMICVVCGAVSQGKSYVKRFNLSFLIIGALTVLCMSVRYMLMGACIMDYKKTIVVMALWGCMYICNCETS
jgi:hypothetical protein